MPTIDIFDLLDSPSVDRVKELEDLINKARDAYYNGVSEISDEIYDGWVDELSGLKHDSPSVVAVGAPPRSVSEWVKVEHTIPMGSLNKVKNLEGFSNWLARTGCQSDLLLVTEKLDGISVSVEYVKGAFSRALTRGDGLTGEDISVNVAKMIGVPGKIPGFTGVLRGEIILRKSDYQRYFPHYANSRNAASGISKRYDGIGCEHLKVLFYQVGEGKNFESESEQFEWLESVVSVPNWYVTTMMPGVKTPHDIWLEYQQGKRDQLDYEIDGLVVRINDLTAQISLGEVDSCPKGAVAFKFLPLVRESVLEGIEWQVGGTGRVTPVAVFQPVQLLGAEVRNASLYNVSYIQSLALDVGATILVTRAQDVIPRVVSVKQATGTVAAYPKNCPECGALTRLEGEYLLCSNTSGCPAQTVGRLKRYVASMGIKEWGDVLLEHLVSLGWVSDVADLYKLTESQLTSIDRMGSKSAQKALKTLHGKNKVSLWALLGSLSIPLCASNTIKLVFDAGFSTLESLKSASVEELSSVEGLGPIKAAALHLWLRNDSYIVDRLLALGLEIDKAIEGPLTGKSVCFTGSSSKPRPVLEEMVRAAGGEVKKSVVKKLSFLVMADPNSNSSKARAARKNNTVCISEAELLGMLGI